MPDRRPSPGRNRSASGEHRSHSHRPRSKPEIDVAWGSLDELWGPNGERSGAREAGEWPLDVWGANGASLTGEPGLPILVMEPEVQAVPETEAPPELPEAAAGTGARGPGQGPPAGQATSANGDSPGAQQRSDLSTLARGGTLNFVGAVCGGLFSFLLVIVVTRGLGKPKAGAFFEAMALFQIVMNTATFGADDGLTRMIPRYIKLGRARDVRTLLRV